MATFYTGSRTVLRGRNLNDMVHAYTGVEGTYSYYSNYNSGGTILTGAPNSNYALGVEDDIGLLEYVFMGRPHVAPLNGPGLGTRLAYHRWHPWENKAAGNNKAFVSGFGHAPRTGYYGNYSNYVFDGLDSAAPLQLGYGHAHRVTSAWGGAWEPYINKGVGEVSGMADPGQGAPADHTSVYGRNRVNVWRGTPSSRAL